MYSSLMLSGEKDSSTPSFRQNQQGLDAINTSLNSQIKNSQFLLSRH
jgi:hypothetical protein